MKEILFFSGLLIMAISFLLKQYDTSKSNAENKTLTIIPGHTTTAEEYDEYKSIKNPDELLDCLSDHENQIYILSKDNNIKQIMIGCYSYTPKEIIQMQKFYLKKKQKSN